MNKRFTYKLMVLSFMAITLQSCFVAKQYDRPEIVDQTKFRTDGLTQDSLPMGLVSWQELFTDSILQNHIQEGLDNNIDIRMAIEQITVAEAYLKQGKSGYFPTLNGSTSYTRQELSSNSQFGSQFSTLDQYQISANLSWEADVWGKIRSGKRAFGATYLQSVAVHKAVKSRLVADITNTYYQLLALDEQLKITEKTVETRSNSLETTRALKEAGIVTEVGVKQTEAQLYTAQAIAIDIRNQVRLLENTMSILMGGAPKQIERTTLDEQNITSDLKIGVPLQLLQNRPDVMAAEYGLINAFELTNVARASFYPSFTLGATTGLQSLDFDALFDSSSLFTTLVGGLAQPILNGRRIRTQYEVAQAQQEQARLDFKYAVLVASKEVSDALFSYEASTEKIGVKEKEYQAYALATEYSEELLNNGLVNYLEVLRARENELNTSLDLINTRNAQLQSIVNLYQALGGGW